MKALQYLQKVGAVPDYEKWDILMALVVITKELFSADTVMEPDVIDWTQEAESSEEFEKRCDAILFATAGDVRAVYPHICNETEEFLRELLEVLLEIRLFYFAEGIEPDSEEWFVNNYNDFLDLKKSKKFSSKAAILHFYYSGSLIETGQEIMAEIAGTEVEFVSQISQIQAEFVKLASQTPGVTVGETKVDGDRKNPFEGGPQARVLLHVPAEEAPQECTLHWAPWPIAKTKSNAREIAEVCETFSRASREKWFSELKG